MLGSEPFLDIFSDFSFVFWESLEVLGLRALFFVCLQVSPLGKDSSDLGFTLKGFWNFIGMGAGDANSVCEDSFLSISELLSFESDVVLSVLASSVVVTLSEPFALFCDSPTLIVEDSI